MTPYQTLTVKRSISETVECLYWWAGDSSRGEWWPGWGAEIGRRVWTRGTPRVTGSHFRIFFLFFSASLGLND